MAFCGAASKIHRGCDKQIVSSDVFDFFVTSLTGQCGLPVATVYVLTLFSPTVEVGLKSEEAEVH